MKIRIHLRNGSFVDTEVPEQTMQNLFSSLERLDESIDESFIYSGNCIVFMRDITHITIKE